MQIESSLPGAVASHSRSSSHDEGQPAQLPRPLVAQPVPQPALVVVVDPQPSLDDVRIVVKPSTPGAEQPGAARELSAPGSTQEVGQGDEQSEPAAPPVAHGQPQRRESWGSQLCNDAGDVCRCICLSPIIIVAATVGSLFECVGYCCDYPRTDHFLTWGDVYRGVRDWVREA